jgi:hypothetical protein
MIMRSVAIVGLMLLCPRPGTALLTGLVRYDGRVLPTTPHACRPVRQAASRWRPGGNEMRRAAASTACCATPGPNPGDGAQTTTRVAIGAGKSSSWHCPVLFRWTGADGRMRAGLFSNMLVWCSLVSVKTTGGGLPAGPFGLLGATQMYRAELGCISHPYVHLCI